MSPSAAEKLLYTNFLDKLILKKSLTFLADIQFPSVLFWV